MNRQIVAKMSHFDFSEDDYDDDDDDMYFFDNPPSTRPKEPAPAADPGRQMMVTVDFGPVLFFLNF